MLFLVNLQSKSVALDTEKCEAKVVGFSQLRTIRFTNNKTYTDYFQLGNETFVLHELLNPSAYLLIHRDTIMGTFFLPRGMMIYNIVYDALNNIVYVRLSSKQDTIIQITMNTQITYEQEMKFRKEFEWNSPITTSTALNTNGAVMPGIEFIDVTSYEQITILANGISDRWSTGFDVTVESEFDGMDAVILQGQGVKLYCVDDLYFRHNGNRNFDLLDMGSYEDVEKKKMMAKTLFPMYKRKVLEIYNNFSQQYRAKFDDSILNYIFNTKLHTLNKEFASKTNVIDIVTVLNDAGGETVLNNASGEGVFTTHILYYFALSTHKDREEFITFSTFSK